MDKHEEDGATIERYFCGKCQNEFEIDMRLSVSIQCPLCKSFYCYPANNPPDTDTHFTQS